MSVIINICGNLDLSFVGKYGGPDGQSDTIAVNSCCERIQITLLKEILYGFPNINYTISSSFCDFKLVVHEDESIGAVLPASALPLWVETAPRLTNGEDSWGTGQNVPANYANKWRSPAVMAGVI